MGYAWSNYKESIIEHIEEMLLDNYESGTKTAKEVATKLFELLHPEGVAC